MAKYSYELKKEIVKAYLSGEGGCGFLANKYGIRNEQTIRKWVKANNSLGVETLMRSRNKQSYSFDFKLHVVKLYLTTEVSYQELALNVGINNPPLITRWVNDYRIAGPDALRSKKKGRRPKVAINSSTEEKSNIDSEYLRKLEEENLKLRIENAYLKELRRLRLEETPQSKKRELSTASEENSN